MQRGLYRLIIDGEEVASASGATSEIHNPARTKEVVGNVSVGSIEDAKKAIDAAYDAYGKWSETTPDRDPRFYSGQRSCSPSRKLKSRDC